MEKNVKTGRNSLKIKMVIILVLLILPFNLVSVLISLESIYKAREQTITSMENVANLAMQQLDTRISYMNDFFYNMETDREAFQIYATQGERNGQLVRAETELAKYLNTNTSNDASADCIFWHSIPYNRVFISLSELEDVRDEQRAQLKKNIMDWLYLDDKNSFSNWNFVVIGDKEWLLKVYQKGDFYYGGLFSLENIGVNLKNNASFSDIQVQFGTKDADIQVPEDQLSVLCSSNYANVQMQLLVPAKEGYARLTQLQILGFGLVFLYVLLIPVLFLVMNGMVLKPLRRVGEAMIHLRNGEQSYRIENMESTDEFRNINQTFNEMADRIQKLKIENYEKELGRKKMELQNLQLQIRPHFLMNMFNMLYSFAQIENYQNIQKLALYLSDYFRHIFQSGKELQPFEYEFQLIQKYLDISSIRYPGWYEVVYDIDPEALEVDVPPLLIHNFVENIFKHVINYEQVIHIAIEVFCTEHEAIFKITDDGMGMDTQMVERINQGIFLHSANDRVHVGIENAWRRLQYFYGEKGKLQVESAPGQGTCFIITIPKGEEL